VLREKLPEISLEDLRNLTEAELVVERDVTDLIVPEV